MKIGDIIAAKGLTIRGCNVTMSQADAKSIILAKTRAKGRVKTAEVKPNKNSVLPMPKHDSTLFADEMKRLGVIQKQANLRAEVHNARKRHNNKGAMVNPMYAEKALDLTKEPELRKLRTRTNFQRIVTK